MRDISEVLSELEEQEEPKEESSNGSNKFVYNHVHHDDSDADSEDGGMFPTKDGHLR